MLPHALLPHNMQIVQHINAKVVILVALHAQGHLQIVLLALALTISSHIVMLVY